MSQHPRPRIEFPCADYSLKVIGRQRDDFASRVLAVISAHAPDVSHRPEQDLQPSRNGRFLSFRCRITATGPRQLEAIQADLMATGLVQMVI